MPELKNTFTGGRMDKDQDERILDSKSYREALNIEIFTTEDSDIGSAQNILGNIQVTKAIQGPSYDYSNCNVVSIVDNAKNTGFRELAKEEALQEGDVLLMSIMHPTLNHVAIFLGDMVLHHLADRLSCKEPYSEWLLKCTGKRYRYASES
jgi:cell wall-associated NlpC family hydrolase